MRLPQSINRSLSVFTLHFLANGIALLLFGMVSMSASATVPQLACSPTTLRFGAVIVGQTETQMITVTNTGLTSTTLSEITVNNPEFTASNVSLPLVLSAGQSVAMSVTFTPSATEWTGGRIQVKSAGSPLLIQVEGTGVSSQTVTASPTSLSFGQVAMGSTATLPVVITNNGSSSVTVAGVQSADVEFGMRSPAVPLTLGPGQSVTLSVTFTPQSTGVVGGSLFFYGLGRLNIPLTGTGTDVVPGQLSVAPVPLNFGSVAVGSTTTQPITLSASGASVTISSTASSSSQFALQGMSLPLTIPAGQQMSFNVAFTPQSSGTASGALSFTSNAANAAVSESLSGTGT
ncbi:MAG: choice-of-anchor D domain-containing protein, partial [Candidatus Sulfotelmatobacter sp.]